MDSIDTEYLLKEQLNKHGSGVSPERKPRNERPRMTTLREQPIKPLQKHQPGSIAWKVGIILGLLSGGYLVLPSQAKGFIISFLNYLKGG